VYLTTLCTIRFLDTFNLPELEVLEVLEPRWLYNYHMDCDSPLEYTREPQEVSI
jgi:hypothetical protein